MPCHHGDCALNSCHGNSEKHSNMDQVRMKKSLKAGKLKFVIIQRIYGLPSGSSSVGNNESPNPLFLNWISPSGEIYVGRVPENCFCYFGFSHFIMYLRAIIVLKRYCGLVAMTSGCRWTILFDFKEKYPKVHYFYFGNFKICKKIYYICSLQIMY